MPRRVTKTRKQTGRRRKPAKLDHLYKKYRLAKAEVEAADRLLAQAEQRAKTAHDKLKGATEAVKDEFRTLAFGDIV
jgi:hypothetical protein